MPPIKRSAARLVFKDRLDFSRGISSVELFDASRYTFARYLRLAWKLNAPDTNLRLTRVYKTAVVISSYGRQWSDKFKAPT